MNIKLAQLINVQQQEQGQAHRMCSVILAVITIPFNDDCLAPATRFCWISTLMSRLKSPGGGKTEEALANLLQDFPKFLSTRILSQISQKQVISMALFELKTFSPAASLLGL